MIKVWELLVYVIGFEITYFVCRYLEEKIHRPDHFRNWKAWKKRNTNNPFHKLFVLFGWSHSPSFECYFALEEYRERWSKEGFVVAETYKDVRRKEKTDEQL